MDFPKVSEGRLRCPLISDIYKARYVKSKVFIICLKETNKIEISWKQSISSYDKVKTTFGAFPSQQKYSTYKQRFDTKKAS